MTRQFPPVSEEDLHGFVDGQLEPGQREQIRCYLQGHPDVASRVADYQAQREQLRSALDHTAREPLPARLDLQLMVQQRLMRRYARWAVAASVVAALLMGGAGGWVLHGQMMPPDSGIALLAREAAANHLVYTADRRRPTELGATQREDLARWVSNRLKRSITIPDLSSTGFQFLGGRLAATHEGPAGLFMYQNQAGVRLTIFVRPVAGPQNMPITQVHMAGLTGCAWAESGIGYTVIAAVPATELRDVAEQVRRLSQNAV